LRFSGPAGRPATDVLLDIFVVARTFVKLARWNDGERKARPGGT
jgi:hypothetical protein